MKQVSVELRKGLELGLQDPIARIEDKWTPTFRVGFEKGRDYVLSRQDDDMMLTYIKPY